jgi:hypothetical protein
MKAKRKSTKPVTLLTKIETLLSDVLGELSSIERSVERNVRALLLSAGESVAKAKDCLIPAVASASAVPHKATRTKKRTGRRLKPSRSAR